MDWTTLWTGARDYVPFAAAMSGQAVEHRPALTRLLESAAVAAASGLLVLYGSQKTAEADLLSVQRQLARVEQSLERLQLESATRLVLQARLDEIDRRTERIESRLEKRHGP